MNIFSFESSCDETSAAVVQDGRKILSNVVNTQIAMHTLYGGVVPEMASRRHTEVIVQVAEEALGQANMTLSDIDAIAATCGPGLIGALLVGTNFAKGLSLATGLPFIPVHHVRAHIAANYLAFPELKPPFLALSVSGGTSLLIDVKDYTSMQIIGGTRDDAAGEVFDKVARVLGIGYPGGSVMDKLSQSGDSTKYPLPRAEVDDSPMDFSFSGLKSASINLIHNSRQKGEEIDIPSFAASFSQAVTDTLVPRTLCAARKLGYKTIIAAGGVAANSMLRRKLTAECEENGISVFYPPLSLCGDNGAMVGAQAYYEYLADNIGSLNQNSFATIAIDKDISKA